MAKRKSFALNKDLQQGLTQTMSAVKNYAGALRFEIIPLQQIELDPENPRDLALKFEDLPRGPRPDDPEYSRKLNEIEKLASLAETIRSQGVINPVVVYKNGEKYRLVAGERRCLASIIANQNEIKANILDQRPTAYNRSYLQWIENIEREDLSLWERLKNIEQIIHYYRQENQTQVEFNASFIKNLLGCSLPHAMNYFSLLQAPKDLQDAVRSENIRNLEKAALIARITDANQRQEAISVCITGASLSELKKLISHDKVGRQKIKSKITTQAKRGRQANRVSLGYTQQPLVVKTIIDAVLTDDRFRRFSASFTKQDWNDYSAVTAAFQKLLTILETSDLD